MALQGGLEIIDQLAEEWRQLCDEGPCDEPFYRPEWVRACVRAFMPRSRLVIAAIRVDDRLRAVLPLVYEKTVCCGLPVRRLRSPTSLHSGRFNVVHGSHRDSAASVQAIWKLLRNTPRWDSIELEHVPEGGAIEQLMQAARLDGYPTGTRQGNSIPYIQLPGPGGDLESALSGTKAKFRSNLRARMRRLEQCGPMLLVRVDRADDGRLDAFYRLEHAGWKGQEGTAIACDARVKQFYNEVALAAERYGYLSLYLLECGGRAVAGHYGLTHRGRYYSHKVAYDESYKVYGPGQLIIQEILRDAVERGLTEFDFIGPWAEWKSEWTSDARRHTYYYLFNRGIIGRALYALMFPIRDTARQIKRRLHASVAIANVCSPPFVGKPGKAQETSVTVHVRPTADDERPRLWT